MDPKLQVINDEELFAKFFDNEGNTKFTFGDHLRKIMVESGEDADGRGFEKYGRLLDGSKFLEPHLNYDNKNYIRSLVNSHQGMHRFKQEPPENWKVDYNNKNFISAYVNEHKNMHRLSPELKKWLLGEYERNLKDADRFMYISHERDENGNLTEVKYDNIVKVIKSPHANPMESRIRSDGFKYNVSKNMFDFNFDEDVWMSEIEENPEFQRKSKNNDYRKPGTLRCLYDLSNDPEIPDTTEIEQDDPAFRRFTELPADDRFSGITRTRYDTDDLPEYIPEQDPRESRSTKSTPYRRGTKYPRYTSSYAEEDDEVLEYGSRPSTPPSSYRRSTGYQDNRSPSYYDDKRRSKQGTPPSSYRRSTGYQDNRNASYYDDTRQSKQKDDSDTDIKVVKKQYPAREVMDYSYEVTSKKKLLNTATYDTKVPYQDKKKPDPSTSSIYEAPIALGKSKKKKKVIDIPIEDSKTTFPKRHSQDISDADVSEKVLFNTSVQDVAIHSPKRGPKDYSDTVIYEKKHLDISNPRKGVQNIHEGNITDIAIQDPTKMYPMSEIKEVILDTTRDKTSENNKIFPKEANDLISNELEKAIGTALQVAKKTSSDASTNERKLSSSSHRAARKSITGRDVDGQLNTVIDKKKSIDAVTKATYLGREIKDVSETDIDVSKTFGKSKKKKKGIDTDIRDNILYYRGSYIMDLAEEKKAKGIATDDIKTYDAGSDTTIYEDLDQLEESNTPDHGPKTFTRTVQYGGKSDQNKPTPTSPKDVKMFTQTSRLRK